MAWNEPGGNKNRDPWGGNGRDQGPPDLDELVRKLSGKFGGLFGAKRGGGNDGGGDGSGGGGSGGAFRLGSLGTWVIIVIVAVIWLASGFYTVEQGRRGVELRFGAYSKTTQPGLRYHLPYPIETVQVVDVERRRSQEIGYRSGGRQAALRSVPQEALMLTEDENIVDVRLSVQYEIENPKDYLFNVRDPDQTLVQVIESSIREVVGRQKMDFLLTEGRAAVVDEVKVLSQKLLGDVYQSGLLITNVNLQDAQPPEEVQSAFEDAIKAREDEVRVRNEAEAYAREVLPQARGQAARRLQEAQAYKEQVIAQAEGEASRFTQVLVEYQKAPQITRERIYLEALESVFANTSKVLIDVEGGNNLIYLPLDRMMNQPGKQQSSALQGAAGSALAGQSPARSNDITASTRLRDTSRSRGNR